jgi:putative redox protein
MTLRVYAEYKQLELGRISVEVSHAKVHSQDCEDCIGSEHTGSTKIDRFERVISVNGEVSEELRVKIAEIADKCPVHRTLEAKAKVVTIVKSDID